MNRDKPINAWQTGILIFFLLFANKVLVLPSLLFTDAKFEGFIVPIILFMFETGLLLLFFALKKRFPKESFLQILKEHFGKVITIIVFALFALFFLAKAFLLYNITYIFFKNLIYKESTNLLFLVCFLPVINHLAICGFRTMGRTMQLFFPAALLVFIFSLVIGGLGAGWQIVIEQSSFHGVVLLTFKHLAAFGDTIILFLFMDKIEVKKKEWKIVFSLYAISVFMVIAIIVTFFLTYSYMSFLHPFALFSLVSCVKEYYGDIGRIDIISMVLVILITYFHLALYTKAFFVSFDGIFPKLDRVFSLLTFNFVFVLLVKYTTINLSKLVLYGERYLPYLSILSFAIVPTIVVSVLIAKKVRGKRE